jgi:hypothetical protein
MTTLCVYKRTVSLQLARNQELFYKSFPSDRDTVQLPRRLRRNATELVRARSLSRWLIHGLPVEIHCLTDQWLFRSIGGEDVDAFLSIVSGG